VGAPVVQQGCVCVWHKREHQSLRAQVGKGKDQNVVLGLMGPDAIVYLSVVRSLVLRDRERATQGGS
jgi:hypothetical protein